MEIPKDEVALVKVRDWNVEYLGVSEQGPLYPLGQFNYESSDFCV